MFFGALNSFSQLKEAGKQLVAISRGWHLKRFVFISRLTDAGVDHLFNSQLTDSHLEYTKIIASLPLLAVLRWPFPAHAVGMQLALPRSQWWPAGVQFSGCLRAFRVVADVAFPALTDVLALHLPCL